MKPRRENEYMQVWRQRAEDRSVEVIEVVCKVCKTTKPKRTLRAAYAAFNRHTKWHREKELRLETSPH